MFRSCGMYYQRWNSMLLTGGFDKETGGPINKTWEFWDELTFYYNVDLKIPRYFHACGSYMDPETNSQVYIISFLLLSPKPNTFSKGFCCHWWNNCSRFH